MAPYQTTLDYCEAGNPTNGLVLCENYAANVGQDEQICYSTCISRIRPLFNRLRERYIMADYVQIGFGSPRKRKKRKEGHG